MTDFKNAEELLSICTKGKISISEAMKRREAELSGADIETIEHRMKRSFEIMKESARSPLMEPRPSMGGLIGGEADRLERHGKNGGSICGAVLSKAITYACAVIETNASMGLITAAPTAGSSGVVPGVLLSLMEEKGVEEEQVIAVLFNAGAIGYLAMRNATVAGAVGGCQAEVGVAAAMAASASVELMGGEPDRCLDAAAIVLMDMLGLVCDPVGGLVECPCQQRNAAGAAVALTAAEIALSGISSPIPFDQMLEAMYRVGRKIPYELRETALGGCAITPAAKCRSCGRL